MWIIAHAFHKTIVMIFLDVSFKYCIVRWVVVNQCFIHCYETTEKLVGIAVEQRQTFLQNCHTVAFVDNLLANATLTSFLIRKWSHKIETAVPCDMPMACTISGTFNLRWANTNKYFNNCYVCGDLDSASRMFGVSRTCATTTKFNYYYSLRFVFIYKKMLN